ncbi:hypothetical protein BU17DRAFT_69776 [Hysterangium stoloniferum]|nr:hypothetical protein BU17DRAFT_69776 [Hysterangium stoloniferum]
MASSPNKTSSELTVQDLRNMDYLSIPYDSNAYEIPNPPSATVEDVSSRECFEYTGTSSTPSFMIPNEHGMATPLSSQAWLITSGSSTVADDPLSLEAERYEPRRPASGLSAGLGSNGLLFSHSSLHSQPDVNVERPYDGQWLSRREELSFQASISPDARVGGYDNGAKPSNPSFSILILPSIPAIPPMCQVDGRPCRPQDIKYGNPEFHWVVAHVAAECLQMHLGFMIQGSGYYLNTIERAEIAFKFFTADCPFRYSQQTVMCRPMKRVLETPLFSSIPMRRLLQHVEACHDPYHRDTSDPGKEEERKRELNLREFRVLREALGYSENLTRLKQPPSVTQGHVP